MSQQDDTNPVNDIIQDETSQNLQVNSDSNNKEKNYPDGNEEEKMDADGDLQELMQNGKQSIAFFW